MNYDRSPIGVNSTPAQSYYSERGVRPVAEGMPVNRRQRRLAQRALRREGLIPKEPYGDPNLPIASKIPEITRIAMRNPVSVVGGETGSGKSTQVPLGLLNEGIGSILVQPRRLAAEMVADRIDYHVREKRPYDAPGLVGCLTADVNTLTPNTQVSVVTDGVFVAQLPDMLARGDQRGFIMDEVHEWRIETEIALALIKREMRRNPHDHKLHVILMSATHDQNVLNNFFADVIDGPLPHTDIPVAIHEIEERVEPESTVAEQSFLLAKQGLTVLAFQEGKQKIKDTTDDIARRFKENGGPIPKILPLHAKLSAAARAAALADYSGGKIIVATDVAQTSITIPVDAVVDSGLKREKHIDEEYAQSLDAVLASRSDMRQRRGRAGRIKKGLYVVTRSDDDTEFIEIDNPIRPPYSVPEIQRTEADRTALYMAALGLDMEELEFPHPVELRVIQEAKRSLRAIGALDDNDMITPMGRRMEALPMSPNLARMVIESEQYSAETRAQIAAITAAVEAGGLQYFVQGVGKKWKELVSQEESDLLAQLELFLASQEMSPREQAQYNLDPQNIERAQKLYRKIMKRISLDPDKLTHPTYAEGENLKRCIYAGMIDHVYAYSGANSYTRIDGLYETPREISSRSVVTRGGAMVVGYPYRYSYPSKGEIVDKHIVEKVTRVTTPAVLGEIASGLCVWQPADFSFRGGRLMQRQEQQYHSTSLGVSREVEAETNDEAVNYLVDHMLNNPGTALKELYAIERQLKILRKLSPDAPKSTSEDIKKMVTEAARQSGLDEAYADQILRNMIYEKGISLNSYVPEDELVRIYEGSPRNIERFGETFTLDYERGVPLVKRYDLDAAAQLPGEMTLDDGRTVKFVGEHGKHFTVGQLKSKKM